MSSRVYEYEEIERLIAKRRREALKASISLRREGEEGRDRGRRRRSDAVRLGLLAREALSLLLEVEYWSRDIEGRRILKARV